MKNFFKPIPMLTMMIFIILLLVSVSKTKYINTLEKKLDKIYTETNYEHVDSLYTEIMDLGAQLDSMMLKYE